jgi:hypothetical protein
MSSFNDICYKISKLENKLFKNFIECNTFIQSPHYNLIKQNFIDLKGDHKRICKQLENSHNEKYPRSVNTQNNTQNNTQHVNTTLKCKSNSKYNITTVTYNTIHEVLLELVEPGYSMSVKETTIDFCIILDKYKHLLKEVTSRHVLLHNTISAYINRSSGKIFDTSYLNKDFMLFWGCLLDADIYVFDTNKKMYHSYLCKIKCVSENNKFVIIKYKVVEYKDTQYSLFEFVDTTHVKSFEIYNQSLEYNKAFDVNKLHILKVDELRKICNNLKITNISVKTNKADLVKCIKDVFLI